MPRLRTAITPILVLLGSLCIGRRLDGQFIRLTPDSPLPGALVGIAITGLETGRDTVTALRGWMAGEPLHFSSARDGLRHAIGAVPVDEPGTVTAVVVVTRASGRVDTLRASVTPPPLPPPTERLAVAPRFGRKRDAATERRVAAEYQRALEVGRRSHDAPRWWSEPFLRPRTSEVSSGFGTGRTFNGQVSSRHLGVDFRGATGSAVQAANRGVVALVDTFYLGGRVIYVDHGEGVVTGYLHLSRAMVAVGDTVARGQTIGLVGATGRVTGPHLHWNARFGSLTVNPLDLVALAP